VARKRRQRFKTTIHRAHHEDISFSLMLAEPSRMPLGLTPILLSTAGVKSRVGKLGEQKPKALDINKL